jgi:two-component system OmpR family response regulator
LLKRSGAVPATTPSALDSARVVVVHGDAFSHMAIAAALRSAQIIEAWRIHELFTAVQVGAPTAVVIDSRLPDGLGLDAIARLRSMPALADTPVVVLASSDDDRDRFEAFTTGADDVVLRTGDLSGLAVRLERLLDLTPAQRWAHRHAALERLRPLLQAVLA